MSTSTEHAVRVIDSLEAQAPDVVRLATLASIAVRIEPHLIRSLRLQLLPEADVGVEADLWFSPLVESRGADAIVFGNAIVRQLWLRLAQLSQRDDAIAITLRAHASSPPALLLEEQLTGLALAKGHAALPEIEQLLEPAVEALRRGEGRALEVARWMHRARGRLHDVILVSPRMKVLLTASAILLKRPKIVLDSPILADDLTAASALLPSGLLSNTVPIGVAFDGHRIDFVNLEDAPHEIRIPETTPKLLAVRWHESGRPREQVVEPSTDQTVTFGTFQRAVTLTTLSGDVYELSFDSRVQVAISYSAQDRERVAILAKAIEREYGLESVWWDRPVEQRQGVDAEARAAFELAKVVVVVWPSDPQRLDHVYQDAVDAIRNRLAVHVRDVHASPVIPHPFDTYESVDLADTERVLRAIADATHREDTTVAETTTPEQGMAQETTRKTCFVIMGFGEKTDYYSNPQRVLNLDRTYEDIIEPAATAAGLECFRADTIVHSGVIDKPMYEWLLKADLVIADLSTSNANAIYELGIRHALRPSGTIVIAESKFSFPFDVNNVGIIKYEHQGHEIGYRSVLQTRKALESRILQSLAQPETDSPVYMYLPQLRSPDASLPAPPAPSARGDEPSVASLMESVREAKREVKQPEDWLVVVALLRRLQRLKPDDAFVVQQLALATYKSKSPDTLTALQNAREILAPLAPETSTDTETVSLSGAIYKRIWESAHDRGALDMAIRQYSRAFVIKSDYYNGINAAFLLDVRASVSEGDDVVADRATARRLRKEVIEICDAALDVIELDRNDERFWIQATKIEALFGIGRSADAAVLRRQLATQGHPSWMMSALDSQLNALAALDPSLPSSATWQT